MDAETPKAWLVEQMVFPKGWFPVQVELHRDRIDVQDWREVKRGGGLPPMPPAPGAFRITPLLPAPTAAHPEREVEDDSL